MYQKLIFLFAAFLSFGVNCAFGQDTRDSSEVNMSRLRATLIGEATLAGGSLGGLYFLWYADYDHSGFHFINDNNEWLQMDKAGHVLSSYYISKLSFDMLRWSGIDKRKALYYSAPLGFTYLGIVELMDGFSAAWGASSGDLLSNGLGTVAFTLQQACWNDQRLLLKWSFHRTPFASYRPELLGNNLIQEMLKDYNGQSYWISANLWSLSGRPDWLPPWLNLAAGYSAQGMLGGSENPADLPYFERYRQYLLSPDIDFSRIKTDHEWLSVVFRSLNFIKVPMPALCYDSRGRFSFYPIYF